MNPKLIIYGVVIVLTAGVLTTCYMKGRSDVTQKSDLREARKVIVREREVRQVETNTNTRVDVESIDTTRKAEAADNEIERIRTSPTRTVSKAARPVEVDPVDQANRDRDAADAARVMQLAREARAAAVESAAKLQSARAGTR